VAIATELSRSFARLKRTLSMTGPLDRQFDNRQNGRKAHNKDKDNEEEARTGEEE